MRSGELNNRVILQQRATTQDSFGAQINTWSDVTTLWVSIEPLTGRELFAAQAVNTEITHVVKTRYQALFADPKAVAAMRLNYGGRLFNIHAPMNIGEGNREVQLLCSEGLNPG
jgi:SPP1 family predicted phage head-tail adaptor